MNKNEIYLRLKPEVFISNVEGHSLIYNTLNCKYIQSENYEVKAILRNLNSSNDPYTIKVNKEYIKQNPEIGQFINKIIQYSIGELEPKKNITAPNLVLKPLLGIRKGKNSSGFGIDNNHLMEYLSEVTFFINNHCENNCQLCQSAHSQFLTCTSNENLEELNFNLLESLIEKLKSSNLNRINIIGGNIFKYSDWDKLTEILKNRDEEIYYYLSCFHFNNNQRAIEHIKGDSNLVIIINPLESIESSEIKNLFNKKTREFQFSFIVDSEISLVNASKIIKKYNLNSYTINPHYNDKNMYFFQEHVFFDPKNILSRAISIKSIFRHKTINNFNWGRIYIDSSGCISTSLAERGKYKINDKSIRETLYHEINFGRNWTLTRDQIVPCKNCVYNPFCPSISTYEIKNLIHDKLTVPGCKIENI